MKIFWPHRSKADGFSIQNLAREYRLKFSSKSSSKSRSLENKKTISTTSKLNKTSVVKVPIKRKHWANRDFSEYKEAA